MLSEQFSKADYQLVLSQDERRLIVSPALGAPMAIDLQTLKATRVRNVPAKITSKVAFGASSDYAVSQHGGRGLMFWNFSRATPIIFKLIPQTREEPVDFSMARQTNVAAVLTSNNVIEYWDVATRKYLGPAFRSSGASVAGFALSDDARWLLIGLTDGQLVRMRVAYAEDEPVYLDE